MKTPGLLTIGRLESIALEIRFSCSYVTSIFNHLAGSGSGLLFDNQSQAVAGFVEETWQSSVSMAVAEL